MEPRHKMPLKTDFPGKDHLAQNIYTIVCREKQCRSPASQRCPGRECLNPGSLDDPS